MIKVAIIDDHKFLIEGLQQLINQSDTITVTAVGNSVAECRRLMEYDCPDVLLLDIGLPDGDGCELCAELTAQHADLKVVMLTSFHESAVISRALKSGASGYLLKNTTIDEICRSIHAVHSGRQYLSKDVKTTLNKTSETPISLTPREHDILKFIIAGKNNPQIADELFLSPETVKSYRKNLMLKLQVHNTAELVQKAILEKLT